METPSLSVVTGWGRRRWFDDLLNVLLAMTAEVQARMIPSIKNHDQI